MPEFAEKVQISLLSVVETMNIPTELCLKHFPKRMERASRFRFSEDRLRCIGAGALIAGIAGIDENMIEFGPFGKPFSANNRKISVSHSGQYSVLATADCEVGVDIEAKSDHRSIADRVLTEDEIAYVSQDANRFLQIWTLKESVAKLLGMGLSLDFRSLSVLKLLEGVFITIDGRTIYGKTIDLPGHILSVAVEDRPVSVEIRNISADEIVCCLNKD